MVNDKAGAVGRKVDVEFEKEGNNGCRNGRVGRQG